MEPEGSLLCPHKPATSPYLEPDVTLALINGSLKNMNPYWVVEFKVKYGGCAKFKFSSWFDENY
jgi:hypothetical protein